MASSATSVSSFELLEEQQLTEADVAMASKEAQEERAREAAVTAGLVLEEPLVLRFRAICDERGAVYTKLVAGLSKALP